MMNLEQTTAAVLLLSCLACFAHAEDTVTRVVQHPGDNPDTPRIHLVENFATDEEMDYIMKEAFHNMKPQNQEAETGMVYELPVARSDITKNVYNRMSSVFPGIGRNNEAEHTTDTFRVRRYLADGNGVAGGDYHPPHTDWFQSTKGDNSNVLIISMILYLTSPEEGGTTYFPQAWVNGKKGYHFQPKRGNLAAWWSCYRNGTQDWHSSHESTPIKAGIKWNAARFFYDDTRKCDFPAASTVQVPAETNHLRDMGDSMNSMFNTTFPEGVWVTAQGTSHGHTPPKGSRRNEHGYDVQYGQETQDEKVKRLLELYEVDKVMQAAKRNPAEVAQKRMAMMKGGVSDGLLAHARKMHTIKKKMEL